MADLSETEIELLKSRVLGQPAGSIAHDLNNALQTIVGSLTTLEKLIELDQLERAPRFIAAALRSAKRSGELTQELHALEDLFRRICAQEFGPKSEEPK
jgi:C4-dicarboxylate-specific signal transduction histidine kinase